MGGETGSGVDALITSNIRVEYPYCLVLMFSVVHSPKVYDKVGPCNYTLFGGHPVKKVDKVVCIGNEGLYDIWFRT